MILGRQALGEGACVASENIGGNNVRTVEV